MLNWTRREIAVAVVLLFAAAAFAQSCALCYTQAASSGGKLIAALRSGTLVLIPPQMFMSAGITWLAYRKRKQCVSKHPDETLFEEWQDNFEN